MTDFLEAKKVLRPHLPLLIAAAVNVSLNQDMMQNVREVTIHFLELLGDAFAKSLVKKDMALIQQVVEAGFRIACESTDEYPDEEESPPTMALYMLYNYASEIPNAVIYPLFKAHIMGCT